MDEGYDDARFENTVDANLHCPICMNVLKDPVQCRRNQHYFCTSCITKHLAENSQTCPTCMEKLTIETLGKPARILTDLLSNLKVYCDYAEQGCRMMVELGALKAHIVNCDFCPVMCSNDGCSTVIRKRDKELHETTVCGFRMVKCDHCGVEVQYLKYKTHICPMRREIDQIKLDLTEVKGQLNQIRSAQEDMLKEMRGMMTYLTSIKDNRTSTKPVPKSSCRSPINVEEEIIIAGGSGKEYKDLASVETFNWSKKVWARDKKMNQCRTLATSFVYENHMVVTGGFSDGRSKDGMEQVNITQKAGRWVDFPVKLPFELRGHKTILHQDRLLVIGGLDNSDSVLNTIHEVSLTAPYPSKLIIRMPGPVCFHGTEFFEDKIYIVGGKTRFFSDKHVTNRVFMYDLTTHKFKEIAPLLFAVWAMATVSWKDNIIVIGGMNQNGEVLNTVVVYNVNTGKSTMLPEMGKRRSGCTAVAAGNRIVVMGGEDEKGKCLASVECFSFDSYSWKDLAPMNESRIHATAVVKPVQPS